MINAVATKSVNRANVDVGQSILFLDLQTGGTPAPYLSGGNCEHVIASGS